jgi:hypothetical protein
MGVENIEWGEDCILASPNPNKPVAAPLGIRAGIAGKRKVTFIGQLKGYSFIHHIAIHNYMLLAADLQDRPHLLTEPKRLVFIGHKPCSFVVSLRVWISEEKFIQYKINYFKEVSKMPAT